jgi:tRNA (guanine-N7-)-methyltransferase
VKSHYPSLSPLVGYFQSSWPLDWEKVFLRSQPLEVEIGFGLGEVMVRQAKESPQRNFVGIEENWERIFKCLRSISNWNEETPSAKIDNIKILKVDARLAFERLFIPREIDTIYALFPCPWPKKGHVKHRLFSNDFLKLLNNRLKDNGKLLIVTDHYPFCEWVVEEAKGTHFMIRQQTIRPRYDTKFERKWRAEGQEEFFEIEMTKVKHIDMVEKKETEMKSYMLNNFDAEKFSFVNKTGETSVIFKDIIYDATKKTAMVMVLVAEGELSQYLRVIIYQAEKGWRVMRADGQNMFPTPGIAHAIQLVFETAKATCP